MALVRTRIFSIVDAEFDRGFDGSISRMTDPVTGTFPFAELGLTTYEEQKAHLRQFCEDKIASPNAFCFKTEEDGLLLTLVFGLVTNGTLDLWCWLGADDANGSRNYVYDKANVIGFHTWLKEQGITSITSHITEKGTRLKDFTANGNTQISDVSGDWGISEASPVSDEDKAKLGISDYNTRTLTMNSNANIPTNTD